MAYNSDNRDGKYFECNGHTYTHAHIDTHTLHACALEHTDTHIEDYVQE